MNARSVEKNLRVKGCSSFTRWVVVSWSGGTYTYTYIHIRLCQTIVPGVGIRQSYALLTRFRKSDRL